MGTSRPTNRHYVRLRTHEIECDHNYNHLFSCDHNYSYDHGHHGHNYSYGHDGHDYNYSYGHDKPESIMVISVLFYDHKLWIFGPRLKHFYDHNCVKFSL